MKRLLLHIGTGKTGTSSIQNFLFANRKQLAESFSLFYPEQGLSKLEHFGEVIHAHYEIVSWISNRQTEDLEKLSLAMDTSSCETAIISCENFYHHFSAEDIAFLATVFKQFSVEIICYVRRQDLYMESAWKQQVKVGALKASFPDFLQRHIQAKYLEEVHGNYYRMLKPWVAVFGIQNIQVKVFDKSEWLNGDLIDDFLNTCGLDIEKTNSAFIKQAHTNTAFPSELIRLIQKTNAMALIPKANQQDFVDYLSQLNSFNDTPLLSRAERLTIIKNYQPTNRALFTEFCNRQVPKCFKPISIKNAGKRKNTPQVSLEDIAVKSVVAAWKKSSFHIPVSKHSFTKILGKTYKNYLKKPLENTLKTQNNISIINSPPLDSNKISESQSSPFIFKLELPSTTIKDRNGFFFYGFSKSPPLLPPLKTVALSSLPRCSMTVNDCFISAAVINQPNSPKGLLGALYENGRLIESASYRGPGTAVSPIDPPTVNEERISKARFIYGSSVYMGWLLNHFGHLLLEAPARFWILNSIDIANSYFIFHPLGYRYEPILTNILQSKIGQAVVKQYPQLNKLIPTESSVFQNEFLQALLYSFGIRKEQIILADHDLCIEKLIIPSSLFFLNQTVDPIQQIIYNQIKTYFLQNIDLASFTTSSHSPPQKKLYLSRRLLKKSNQNRKASNEEMIEQLFRRYGFEIIFPEQLSLRKQVELLNEADTIAGCDGSALHMGVFLPPSSKMIILSTRGIITNQLLISELNNIETHFINAGKDRSTLQTAGSWEADITFIKEQLDKIIGQAPFENYRLPTNSSKSSTNFDEILNRELSLTNIDNMVMQTSSIASGQHFSYYSLLPESIQKVTPYIWLGNSAINSFQKDIAKVPAANMYEFHNVCLAAHGCIIDADAQLFTSPHLLAMSGAALKVGLNRDLLDTNAYDVGKVNLKNKLRTRKITEPCVPLAQPGEWAYGHWLVDILPRVVFAQKLGIKVKYLSTIRLPDYGRKLLNLIGIYEEDIITYDPAVEAILMDVCFFPSQLRWKNALSPLLVVLSESFLPYSSKCLNRKIFVSRGDYNKGQSITNSAQLYHLMSEYGIEIVEPHKYSQEEQIKLFSEASFVIGEYGSAMHNTLFSPPETKVIVLQSDAPLSFIQAGIGAALNQPTGFVFGQQEKIDTTKNRFSGRSFHAPLNLVKQAIEESI